MSGQCSFVLSSDCQTILWANGTAAYFLGFSNVGDAIGSPSFFDQQTRKQIIEHLANQLPLKIHGKALFDSFALSVVDFNSETCAILCQAITQQDYGDDLSLLAGLETPHLSAAIVNEECKILDATSNFHAIDDVIKILVKTIDDDAIVKTVLKLDRQDYQVGVIRLSEKPASFLIISAQVSSKELHQSQKNNIDADDFPIKFTWKMDNDAKFIEIASAFKDIVGREAADVLGKSLSDLGNLWGDENYLLVDAVIKAGQPWANRNVLWPVQGGGKVVIEFSGLPVLDSQNKVKAYRGFGVVSAFQSQEIVIEDQPTQTIEKQKTETVSLGLSDVERSAFREIAQRLRSELDLPTMPKASWKPIIDLPKTVAVQDVQKSHEPFGDIINSKKQINFIEELDFLDTSRPQSGTLLTLLDTATDGVIWVDRTGKIQSMSSAASALMGYEIDDLNDKKLSDLFTNDSAILVDNYLASMQIAGLSQILNKGETAHIILKDGATLPIFITLVPISERNGYAVLLRDMSAVVKETKSASENQETAHFVHEMRTPLNALIGFAEIMRDGSFGPIENQRYQGYIHDIIVSGKHILLLVNQLLDKAKSQHNIEKNTVLNNENTDAFDLKNALRGCVSLLENQANSNGIIMRVVLPSFIPAIAINEQKFRQIIWNLLSNAIRFTPSGGQVVINASYDGKGAVKVTVSDNGIGMSQQEMMRAMQPYGQIARKDGKIGDNTFTGTGLGLPMTKSMVEDYQGQFLLLSKENRGTTIEMTFPIFRNFV